MKEVQENLSETELLIVNDILKGKYTILEEKSTGIFNEVEFDMYIKIQNVEENIVQGQELKREIVEEVFGSIPVYTEIDSFSCQLAEDCEIWFLGISASSYCRIAPKDLKGLLDESVLENINKYSGDYNSVWRVEMEDEMIIKMVEVYQP